MSKKSNPRSRKSPMELLVAQYGFLGVVIAAFLGTIGTVLAGYLGYLGIQSQVYGPLRATQTAEARLLLTPSPSRTLAPSPTTTTAPTITVAPTVTQRVVVVTAAPIDSSDDVVPAPTIGAQLDFSPRAEINTNEFRKSPFDGVFMSSVSLFISAPSWIAIFTDGSQINAESDVCLMNTMEFTPDVQTGPLNIKTSRIRLYFAIYVDDRYSYEIQDMELFISIFEPLDRTIARVELGIPGAGAWYYPLPEVQAMKTWVDGIPDTMYKIDFEDFMLGPNNGVNITLPVAMIEPGKYQFILKVNGVATPTYAGDPAGKLSLTSNVLDYIWARIDDPRNYEIEVVRDNFGEKIEINLRPCP